jgi:hypothetical protein
MCGVGLVVLYYCTFILLPVFLAFMLRMNRQREFDASE